MARRQKIGNAVGSDAVIRFRLITLGLLLLILVGLVGISLWLRQSLSSKSSQGPSFSELQSSVSGPEFSPDVSAEFLLERARQLLDGLLERYPDSPLALSAKARKSYQLEEARKASEIWRKALEQDPHFAQAMYGLGLIAFDQDRFRDAANCFEDVRLIGDPDPRVPVLIADSYLHLGEARTAALLLEQHIASEQPSLSAWLVLGQAYLQCRDYERAVDSFRKVLKFDSEAKDAVYGLARGLAALGRHAESKEVNKKFQRLAQASREESAAEAAAFRDRNFAAGVLAQVYADIGRVEKQHGQADQAEEALHKAIKLAPQSLDYLEELQALYLQLFRSTEAYAVTQRVLELKPDDSEQLIKLGMLSAELDRSDEAIAAFRKAIELDPDNEVSQRAAQLLSEL